MALHHPWGVAHEPARHYRLYASAIPAPSATGGSPIDGDRVRITGVRNFDYRSREDFTVRHEEREVLLSHLAASISTCPIGARGWSDTRS